MAHQIRLRKIGGSVGVTFPKEVADSFHVQPGDMLNIVRTGRGILLTPYDPVFEEGMRAYEQVNKRYPNALRELAAR